MIRGALLALLLSPLGCTVNALPGSTYTRLAAGDGGLVDLGPGDHGDGGSCGGGNVDLAWGDGGGNWPDGFWTDGGWPVDAGPFDGGPAYDGGPHDGGPHDAGHLVDLAH